MGFVLLAPLALLGLVGLGVPIYLHMRHKPRAVPFRFSALDFLLQARRKRQRQLRVEQLILMLMRLAVLAALVLLFARPFQESASKLLTHSGPLFILLDDSASMLAEVSGETLFDRAKRQIEDQLARASDAQEAYLLLSSNPTGHSQLTTAGAIRRELKKIKPSMRHATLDEAYRIALDRIRLQRMERPQIELYSDHRMTSWQASPAEPEPGIQVHLNDLKAPSTNVGFTQVKHLKKLSEQSGFEVQVFNASNERTSLPISIDVGSMSMEEQIPISPHSHTSHQIFIPEQGPQTERSQQVTFQIPDDAFPLDNREVLQHTHYGAPNILIVEGDPGQVPEDEESYFLGLILEENTQTVTPAGFDRDRMLWADVIIMLNVDEPSPEIMSEALSRKKGILIACGNRLLPETWNPFLSGVGLTLWDWNPLEAPQVLRASDQMVVHSDLFNSGNFPLYFGQTQVTHTQIMTQDGQSLEPVLQLEDGSPLLLAGTSNGGRILVWSSNFDLTGSNLPIQPGFVPLIGSLVDYLFFREQRVEHVYLSVDEAMAKGSDQFSLVTNWTDHSPDSVTSLVPGLYRYQDGDVLRSAIVHLHEAESRFLGLDEDASDQGQTLPAQFQRSHRFDLGRSFAWAFFLLILAESTFAARITSKWGGR